MASFIPNFTSDIMYSYQNEDYQAELALLDKVAKNQDCGCECDDDDHKPKLRVLMIASAGENVLSVSTSHLVEKIYAIDTNEAELHLSEIRRTAATHFSRDQQLRILGADPNISRQDTEGELERLSLYFSIRSYLPIPTRQYWDDNISQIKFGLAHVGRNEQVNHNFQLELQKFDLDPIRNPQSTIENEGWRTSMEKVLDVKRYFSIIQYPQDVVSIILDKMGDGWKGLEKINGFESKLKNTNPLPHDNYFLTTVFDNYYAVNAPLESGFPAFLQSQGMANIRELGVGNERIEFVKGDVFEQIKLISDATGPFHMISISNIPDWMTDDEFKQASKLAYQCLHPGGAFLARMALSKFSMAEIMKGEELQVDESFNSKLKQVERSSWWGQVIAGFSPVPSNMTLL